MKFSFGVTARGVKRDGDHIRVEVAEGEKRRDIDCDVVLVAIGRRPYTGGLGAAEAGVRLDAKGRVEVDAEYRTRMKAGLRHWIRGGEAGDLAWGIFHARY